MDTSSNMYGDLDNVSVGSIAVTDAEHSGLRSGGGDYGSDTDDYEDPQEALVRQKTKSINCTKAFLLIGLLGGGGFLAVAAYLTSNRGSSHAIVVGLVFLVLTILFLRYEFLVSRRNSLVTDIAKRSKHIVDQLFPSGFRDRLLQEGAGRRDSRTGSNHSGGDLSELYVGDDIEKLTKMNTLANQKLSEESMMIRNQPTFRNSQTTVKGFLSAGIDSKKIAKEEIQNTLPIADLYNNTTVLFADIAGFTAWSSQRDPPQVFRLLETLYGHFDDLALKLGVFKVETIGDSYMAVTGLPEPRDDHAVNMARFAYQCLVNMDTVIDELEGELGPGTEELAMRIGLHSGPVTAGILRGVKSRFQLFGDTVNTASRMESTGMPGRIQVSEETAYLLIEAEKQHWIKERMDKVVAKGKGELRTYWLDPRKKEHGAAAEAGEDDNDDHLFEVLAIPSPRSSMKKGKKKKPPESHPSDHQGPEQPVEEPAPRPKPVPDQLYDPPESQGTQNLPPMLSRTLHNPGFTEHQLSDERYKKLVDWNTDVLFKLLESVATGRPGSSNSRSIREVDHDAELPDLPPPFDLVADVIVLPPYSAAAQYEECSPDGLGPGVRADLKAYVSDIAIRYNNVPFHNFEHASHVMMATSKLVSRLTSTQNQSALELHRMTYGISSDPLTHFALVLSALCHDVGHYGVTNAQLILEGSSVADKFFNKSVAEQNSIIIAWDLLMRPRYKTLRSVIYRTNAERKRFRQVMINAILATDISDRGLNQMRAQKWQKAFRQEGNGSGGNVESTNRKATIVLEHLIQVADVAHTMQHWSIYRKWNSRLFEEVYSAYMNGRASFDPTEIWYRGELNFFEYFVIPLARKVNECGVFGESGSQYLTYAVANRNAWEQSGMEALNTIIEGIQTLMPDVGSVRTGMSIRTGLARAASSNDGSARSLASSVSSHNPGPGAGTSHVQRSRNYVAEQPPPQLNGHVGVVASHNQFSVADAEVDIGAQSVGSSHFVATV